MSHLYVLKWFDGPDHLALHTEMREYDQPIEQTQQWLLRKRQPAAGVVYILDQHGLSLTLLRSHVFLNQRGQASAVFQRAIQKHVDTDVAFFTRIQQGTAARKATTSKKTPGRLSPNARRAAAQLPSKAATVGAVLDDIRGKKPMRACKPGFTRGMNKLATQNAQLQVSPRDMVDAMTRFEACDWGDVPASEARSNNGFTHTRRGAIRGVYYTKHSKQQFWIMASPLENAVIVLLPDEN